MKTLIICSVIFFFVYKGLGQKISLLTNPSDYTQLEHENEYLIMEEIRQSWDLNFDLWVNSWKSTYTYDENGNMTKELVQEWIDDQWIDDRITTYTYDENGRETEHISQYWKDEQWNKDGKEKFIYGENRIEQITLFWRKHAWIDDLKFTSTYNEDGNVTEYLSQYWDVAQWSNDQKITNTYDYKGKMTESLSQTWDRFDLWVNDWKTIYTYEESENGYLIMEDFYNMWDSASWINWKKYTYTYDENGNRIEELRQGYYDEYWINWSKYIYNYDENGYRIEFLNQDWASDQWINDWKWTYTYDEYGNRTEILLQGWPTEQWINCCKWIFIYEPLSSIQENIRGTRINIFTLSQNYPNPFNPSTIIEFTLPKSEFVALKVYNILGEEVATLVSDKLQAGDHTYNFEGSTLASGVYLYRIEAGEYNKVKKMILLK
jgi:hypothetical protein